MLTKGDSYGDYVIEDHLDEGGHAHIYAVRHRISGTLHALKVLHSKRADIRRRFLAEGRTLMTLRHPNIVPVLEVIEHDEHPALVLEYVDGMALDHWINAGLHDWDEREPLIHGIIEGLGHAHAHGVIHRDLQPANVLVGTDANGKPIARLIDFGLAKDLATDGTTRTGSTLGTPGYMAPEQIRDSKDVDKRADLFSLGCVMYVLVCEAEPFDGPTDVAIFNATCEARYISPERMAPDVPPAYHAAIRRCLAVDRDKRIASVDALRRLLAGEPEPEPAVVAPPVKPSSNAGPAIATIVVLLVLALWGWLAQS